MTEEEARKAVEANGYKVIVVRDRKVIVEEGKGSRARTFSGVNFRDLCQHFRLHHRPAA